MAKSTCTVRISLELNRDEATWLRAHLQNPIVRDHVDGEALWEEDPRDRLAVGETATLKFRNVISGKHERRVLRQS